MARSRPKPPRIGATEHPDIADADADADAGEVEDLRFEGCKLDYANFRHCTIEYSTFEDCVLSGADFQGAKIHAARFAGCQLSQADFTKAELSFVDLRGSELALAGSVLGLSGATVDSPQLIDLLPAIAAELGILVEDGRREE